MVVVEPVFAEVALEHEVLDVVSRVGLLAMAIDVEESVIVLVPFVHVILLNCVAGLRLFIKLLVLIVF